jgi:hypothetical protein
LILRHFVPLFFAGQGPEPIRYGLRRSNRANQLSALPTNSNLDFATALSVDKKTGGWYNITIVSGS